ncbi:hypothetical protein K461DRAFT_292665 [Myriangium duriaei CBS 260.36]|uniref:Antifungal protein n=1 Tax=Myriangium duriaei CBS 260.36 TaxID=1168546 RepID=A0A9P4J2K4_9PEZI|nr:hypothetical protein K461DRAFT_292665 [Myriangium duriaei CBS 260.36]
MLFKASLLYIAAIVFAGQTLAAAAPQADSTDVAKGPVEACHGKHAGDHCEWKPSGGHLHKGKCHKDGNELKCKE